jgi:hypothetical protein
MEASSTTRPAEIALDPRWKGLCQHIHTTDEISFKLLALVPLVSIAGITTTLLTNQPKFTPVVALLSLFAAAVTHAIWIWERRNIQTCQWLLCRAADLERRAFGGVPGQFFAAPEKPGRQGKTEAERLVYGLTIGAWLLLPGAVFASQWPGASAATVLGAGAYALAAGWLGVRAWRAVHLKIEINPDLNVEHEGHEPDSQRCNGL